MKKFEGEGWELHNGACADVIRDELTDQQFDFAFADPPFNIGHQYREYVDAIPRDEYRSFTLDWLASVSLVMREGGTLCVHVPDDLVEVVFKCMPSQFTRVDWLIWHYRFGQCGRSHFINSKAHCLVYVYAEDEDTLKQRTWNWQEVLTPSDRAAVYNDERTKESKTPGERVMLDVFDDAPNCVFGLPDDGKHWGRVQGNSKERRPGHPNQLPEVYVDRCIRAFSNAGDKVLCPFAGSGTEMVVALAAGREVVGVEISESNCKDIVERIEKGAVRV